MKKILLSLCLLTTCCAYSQTFLGQWRDHLSYRECIDVTQSPSQAIFATQNSVFFVDKNDLSIDRLNKVHGLTDVGISKIAFSEENNLLVVGYADGGINLVKENSIVNMPDILNSIIIGDKGINDIFFQDQFAWLATGFGIVVIDLEREEVRDTYIIGPNASQQKMTGIGILNDTIYASSIAGLQFANINNVNLADFTNWSIDNSLPVTANGYSGLEIFNNTIWLISDEDDGTNEIAYYRSGDIWLPFFDAVFFDDISSNANFLTFASNGGVQTYNTDLQLHNDVFALASGNPINAIAAVAQEDGLMWFADTQNGAVRALNTWTNQEVLPNGPFSNSVWSIESLEGDTWVAPGSFTSNWDNSFNNDSFFYFKDGVWRDFKDDQALSLSRDHVALAIDPSNENNIFFGSWNQGLVEVKNGQIIGVFNETNGADAVQESIVNPGVYRIGGMDFDDDGNLWMSNSHGEDGIAVRRVNGSYVGLNYHPTLPNASVNEPSGELIHTSEGQIWTIIGRSNGLFVADYKGSIANQNDDSFKRLNTAAASGGLHTNDVRTIAEDLDGEIWVGTAEGITVFYNPTNIFTSNPSNAQRILIRQDGNLQWLLETEVITTIAIDGGNRKWIGTESSGVFLMSEDGTDEILHFTSENSPLFSNTIRDISINQLSGEIFIGTSQGLISYSADAIIPFEENECVNVYPNPVRREFTGDVSIDGLMRDAIVKITDISGNLVKETTSNGGRAVWDRTNFAGERVKTGVYLAMAVDEEGESSCVTKILVIN